MRKILITLFLLFPFFTFAHLPTVEQAPNGDAQNLSDPTEQSVAVYGSLASPDEVDVFMFTTDSQATIPIEVLVPVRNSNAFFHPTIVVAHESFPEYQGERITLPEGYGGIIINPPMTNSRSVFFEPFSQERLYHGTEYMIDVAPDDTYYVYLYDHRQQMGDYSLGIGTVENFQDQDFGDILKDVSLIKFGLVGNASTPTKEILGLFLLFAGFVIGLGAVTVIDLHGFLARTSSYWTKATIRTHKITKPLIWIGISLVVVGGILTYSNIGWTGLAPLQSLVLLILIINGCFLTFSISPYLLRQEKDGKDGEILPKKLQRKIMASFIVSFLGWWSLLLSFIWYIVVLR